MSHQAEEVLICPSCFQLLVAEWDVFWLGSKHVESQSLEDGKVCRRVFPAAQPIFAKKGVELPMQAVFRCSSGA
jgi:hypothetical protein